MRSAIFLLAFLCTCCSSDVHANAHKYEYVTPLSRSLRGSETAPIRDESVLWTELGRHSRQLLDGLEPRHVDGKPGARMLHSSVVSLNVTFLMAQLTVNQIVQFPILTDRNTTLQMCQFVLNSNLLFEKNSTSTTMGIRTMRGRAVAGQVNEYCHGSILNLIWSPILGFYGQIQTLHDGTAFIDPYTMFELDTYNVYTRAGNGDDTDGRNGDEADPSAVECQVTSDMQRLLTKNETVVPRTDTNTSTLSSFDGVEAGNYIAGDDLNIATILGSVVRPRKFRFAVATNEEYVTEFGNNKTAALHGVAVTVSRMNFVFEHDFKTSFVLVSNENLMGTTIDVVNNLGAITNLLTNELGSTNYDLGHFFRTTNSGSAQLGVLCDSRKGDAYSGFPNVKIDAFHIDFVSHEVGHQLSASHTFIGCFESNPGARAVDGLDIEPGSGSSILGYAGLCKNNNLQLHSDPYYHGISVLQIANHINTRSGVAFSNCGISFETNENEDDDMFAQEEYIRPVVKLGASSFTVPLDTPFELTVNDPNPALMYGWDQNNPASNSVNLRDNGNDDLPRFRSYMPTVNAAQRWFPSKDLLMSSTVLSEDIGGNDGQVVSAYEIKSTIAKSAETLSKQAGAIASFFVTARSMDGTNGASVGMTSIDVITSDVGPFELTFPTRNGQILFSKSIVQWNVNGADKLSSTVQILVSIDNGQTFISVATNVPNTGSFAYSAPQVICPDTTDIPKQYPNGRLQVRSTPQGGQSFFSVSTERVSVNCAASLEEPPVGTIVALVVALGLGTLGTSLFAYKRVSQFMANEKEAGRVKELGATGKGHTGSIRLGAGGSAFMLNKKSSRRLSGRISARMGGRASGAVVLGPGGGTRVQDDNPLFREGEISKSILAQLDSWIPSSNASIGSDSNNNMPEESSNISNSDSDSNSSSSSDDSRGSRNRAAGTDTSRNITGSETSIA